MLPDGVFMLPDGCLDAWVDVEGLENAIKTSAPDMDGVLEGAGQHRMAVAVLQSQVVALEIGEGSNELSKLYNEWN